VDAEENNVAVLAWLSVSKRLDASYRARFIRDQVEDVGLARGESGAMAPFER
jgi:hypothetical protein